VVRNRNEFAGLSAAVEGQEGSHLSSA